MVDALFDLHTIESRLAQLDEERAALLTLKKIYSGGTASMKGARAAAPSSPSLFESDEATEHVSRMVGKVPPPRTSGNGTTEAILNVVGNRPNGIEGKELVRLVLNQIDAKATNPRRNVRNIIRYVEKSGRIKQDRGLYYLGE